MNRFVSITISEEIADLMRQANARAEGEAIERSTLKELALAHRIILTEALRDGKAVFNDTGSDFDPEKDEIFVSAIKSATGEVGMLYKIRNSEIVFVQEGSLVTTVKTTLEANIER